MYLLNNIYRERKESLMAKAKETSIDIGVSVNATDETAEFCIAVLNNWMKNGDRHLNLCEREDGTQFLIEY